MINLKFITDITRLIMMITFQRVMSLVMTTGNSSVMKLVIKKHC